MTDALVVLCTCTNNDEAVRLATVLVEERLAACVNLLPSIQSFYRWQGAMESAHEVLAVIKCTRSVFPRLRDRIVQLHSYDTPEILALSVVDGSEKYLEWLREQIGSEDDPNPS
jgi:periplasmic divalent cation tolerance protein